MTVTPECEGWSMEDPNEALPEADHRGLVYERVFTFEIRAVFGPEDPHL